MWYATKHGNHGVGQFSACLSMFYTMYGSLVRVTQLVVARCELGLT